VSARLTAARIAPRLEEPTIFARAARRSGGWQAASAE
jgi:hypothetical protein